MSGSCTEAQQAFSNDITWPYGRTIVVHRESTASPTITDYRNVTHPDRQREAGGSGEQDQPGPGEFELHDAADAGGDVGEQPAGHESAAGLGNCGGDGVVGGGLVVEAADAQRVLGSVQEQTGKDRDGRPGGQALSGVADGGEIGVVDGELHEGVLSVCRRSAKRGLGGAACDAGGPTRALGDAERGECVRAPMTRPMTTAASQDDSGA